MDGVPDLGALALVDAVARTGSISAAARETGVSQQSASTRLRQAERMLGLELFRRTTHGALPTPQGEVVAAWAADVLDAAGRLRVGVETLRDARRLELTVAASQTVSAHLVPRWLVALRERQMRAGAQPTAVRLVTGNSVEVEELVRTGRADLGFIESTALPPGLSRSVVAHDELALVVAPRHPLAPRERMTVAELAGVPVVAREEGSGTRRTWEDAVRARLGRDPVPPAVVLPTSAAVRSAVAEGLAPALLSRRAVVDDIRLGRLIEVPVEGEPIARPITALWRGTERDLPPTSRELVETAVESGDGRRLDG